MFNSYEPYMYHSTPKSKAASSSSAQYLSSLSSPHVPVNQPSALAYARLSPPTAIKSSPNVESKRTSLSPNQGRRYAPSPTRHSYVSELENTTIQKQRRELHLLIGELQDRDRELNEMVASHQKQLLAWEQDRQKLLTLEQRYARLEAVLRTRTEKIKTQSTKLKVLESQGESKELALQSTQTQLEQVSEKAIAASRRVQELEEHSAQLNGIVHDLSSKVGHFEAREQELLTMLKLKDNDLAEASAHITDMSSKLKRLDHANKELRHTETMVRKDLLASKQKHSEVKEELEKLNGQMNEQNNTNTEQSIELGQLQGEIQALQQEITLAGEREKRKDQLLDLQRSKQERSDAELSNLRQVYERQQRDLSLLQLSVDSKNEILIRSQLSNSQHSDHNHTHTHNNSTKSPANKSANKSHNTSLRNSSLGAALPEEHNGQRAPDNSSEDTEDLLTADDSGEMPADEVSPTSKLHRLLTESRQMVQNLEQTTLPPYISKPNKQEESSPPVATLE